VAAVTGRGRVVRVSGPLVEVDGLPGLAMSEVVELGPQRVPGEVVALADGVGIVEAYEYTGGLGPDAKAYARGEPLSASLGPGLLGGVFDGLLRPLSPRGTWLLPGATGDLHDGRTWSFTPAVHVGDTVAAGDIVGTVAGDGPVELRVLVPSGVAGTVGYVAAAGDARSGTALAMIDGTEVGLTQRWPVRRARPYRERLDSAGPLVTGQRALDLLYPIALGSTAAVPGGFGTGKTVLLQQIAKWSAADVIVYVGCGERGNEMADVVAELAALEDPRTGGSLSRRTVVIANTSNMPLMAREVSIYTGVTVAEYFRDMGYDAVVIADSTSRWAEALREFASRTGALPAEEGYPADLASALAAFYERAGRVLTLGGRTGSVTVIGAVSPPGGDLTEPVTANTERFVRCLWTLDRELAYARHYPAVSWTGSFSRDADALAAWYTQEGDAAWARRRGRVTALLAEADRLAALAELVGVGSLPAAERIVLLAGRLLREGVLQQSALSPSDASCTLAKGGALVDAVLAVVDRCLALVERGVLAATLEEVDFGLLVRARDETGADEIDGVRQRRDAVLDVLDQAADPNGRMSSGVLS
jgi:V/A-type H+/Na+-transporting ATPase subunit A